jgi:hypothetical protein
MGAPQGYDPKELTYRIGTFFLMVGIGLIVFFVLSDAAKKPHISIFLLGDDPAVSWSPGACTIPKICQNRADDSASLKGLSPNKQ